MKVENINKIHLKGHLGGDPEIKNFKNEIKMARFSLATKEEFTTRSGEKASDTQWHYIVAWNEQALIAEITLHKGCLAEVEGRLVTRNYTDKYGIKRYHTEIVANKVILINESNEKH